MNEIDFRTWLYDKGNSKKLAVDIISRVKRVEREIGDGDIDEQYRNDKCERLIRMLSCRGLNPEMAQYPNANLPIGKDYIAPYRRAVRLYAQFRTDALK